MLSKVDIASFVIEYAEEEDNVFSLDSFWRLLKKNGYRVSKDALRDYLLTCDYVFPLLDDHFISRNGAFKNRLFSFKPSKEEVKKGKFIIGHRLMPFGNPYISPDRTTIISGGRLLESTVDEFSMNLAMDTYAFFGDGYTIPAILADSANSSFTISDVQYSLPVEISLTCWNLSDLADGKDFEYGDRILCRIIDWRISAIEVVVQKTNFGNFKIDNNEIEREVWYSVFETSLLESFDKNGPADSIEQQLAFLFLENQEELCITNCGSAEEFLQHTKKIGFSPYGVEDRLWREGELVPFMGPWNDAGDNASAFDVGRNYTLEILDGYLKNYIFEQRVEKSTQSVDELSYDIFPVPLKFTFEERKNLIERLKERLGMLEPCYSEFSEFNIAPLRKRMLELFTNLTYLISLIGSSGVHYSVLPQQELVVLLQLKDHVQRMLEEIGTDYLRDKLPLEDLSLSVGGMEETFENVGGIVKSSLDYNTSKGFELVK